MQPALETTDLRAGYGDVEVLDGVSLQLMPGEIVALIGANGVGKTTLLRTISGLVRATGGAISLLGERIDGLAPHKVAEAGFVQSPEGKQLFLGMSIQENLMVGAHNRRAYPRMKTTMEEVYRLFPILAERRDKAASTLSGGQQQMLAVGRALMARPKVLALDELSLGLAPIMVDRLFEAVREVRKLDIPILIIEQNVFQVLSMADRGYVLERGRVALSGTGRELLENQHLRSTYLGI